MLRRVQAKEPLKRVSSIEMSQQTKKQGLWKDKTENPDAGGPMESHSHAEGRGLWTAAPAATRKSEQVCHGATQPTCQLTTHKCLLKAYKNLNFQSSWYGFYLFNSTRILKKNPSIRTELWFKWGYMMHILKPQYDGALSKKYSSSSEEAKRT